MVRYSFSGLNTKERDKCQSILLANLHGAAGLDGKCIVSLTCSNCMQIDLHSLESYCLPTFFSPKFYINIYCDLGVRGGGGRERGCSESVVSKMTAAHFTKEIALCMIRVT